MVDFKNEQKDSKEKEIVIRLHPRSVLKGFLFILLLVSTFYLGRFSVEPPAFSDVSLSGAASAEGKKVADVLQEDKTASVEKKSQGSPAAPTAAATVKNEAENTDGEKEGVDDSDSTETAPADTGPVVTAYTGKTALAIESVKTAWKETYGKITDIEYTLKNNEAGTVKPAYFQLMVEGYDDFEKKVPLPASKQSVSAGETQKYTVKVPYGFAYNKATVPDLSQVLITLILYDASDKQMTSATKRTALEWKESNE